MYREAPQGRLTNTPPDAFKTFLIFQINCLPWFYLEECFVLMTFKVKMNDSTAADIMMTMITRKTLFSQMEEL